MPVVGIGMFRIVSTVAYIANTATVKIVQWFGIYIDVLITYCSINFEDVDKDLHRIAHKIWSVTLPDFPLQNEDHIAGECSR